MEKSSRNKKIAIIGHAGIGVQVSQPAIKKVDGEIVFVDIDNIPKPIQFNFESDYQMREELSLMPRQFYLDDHPSLRRSKHQCTRLLKPRKKNKKTHRKKKR